MPVREGKLQCTSCHNPHGTANDKLLKEATVNEVCYTCHAEKRGPYLFEHAPARDNCLSCHEPLRGESCGVCHEQATSHELATPLPSDHVPGMNCRQCHGNGQPLPHVDNGQLCTSCHR